MHTPLPEYDRGSQRQFPSPGEALTHLLERLAPVEAERLGLADCSGRIAAESIRADRPHPASDVSAMDGYAVRIGDAAGKVPVCWEVDTGRTPPPLPPGACARIFTGGVVPEQAEAVIRREDVSEASDHVVVPEELSLKRGQNIRYRGENAEEGAEVVRAGSVLTPAGIATAAAFGHQAVCVYRSVRVGVMVTGNEVVRQGEAEPAQIADTNGPAVHSLLARVPYAAVTRMEHVGDDAARTRDVLASLVEECDAVLVTGGVSVGDHDYVPAAAASMAEIVFHGLPVRPGRPILAAVCGDGRLIVGLPGNPLSVMTGLRRFGLAAIRKRAGAAEAACVPAARLANPDGRTLRLWWYRPVRLTGDGVVELVPSRGSGDVVSGAASDGFIELPPKADGEGPWPFYRWTAEE